MHPTPRAPSLSRRDFIRLSSLGSVWLGSPSLWGSYSALDPLQVAESAGAWIRGLGVETPAGLTWPVAPGHLDDPALDLYSGTPGIVLFLLELHAATGKQDYLVEAEAGADQLVATYMAASVEGREAAPVRGGGPSSPGLYTGMAGVAYTLAEVYEAGGQARFRDGALALLDRLLGQARTEETGILWHAGDPRQASYDIISGSAGIGLTLLFLHEHLGHPHALDAAARAGDLLRKRGRQALGGMKWPMSETYPTLMPNFSHGTAGVVYFLVRLAEATGRDIYLEEAIQGCEYLRAASLCDDGGCLLFHHEPGGEDLFYLSWCHGPVGTARAFHAITRATGEDAWLSWVGRGADAIRTLGVPEKRTPGYWNNVSQCCGDAGVGDFFLSLHRVDPEAGHGQFAQRIAEYLATEATSGGSGTSWIQAEHRTRPDYVMAQTGWMQGAAGVGAFFLHLDGMEKGRKDQVVFPDSSWPSLA